MNTTCLYYTGHLPPESFLARVRQNLEHAAAGLPIISVSHQEIKFGFNICLGDQPKTFYTVQEQISYGLKFVATEYVAFCEDDTLYSYDHLHWIPPTKDTFYYNVNRWTVEPDRYWWASRMNQSQLICSTELARNYFCKRFNMLTGPDDPRLCNFQEPGRTNSRYDRDLGLGTQKAERVEIKPVPLVVFNLKQSLRGLRRISKNAVFADVLPWWGSARNVYTGYTAKTLMEVL